MKLNFDFEILSLNGKPATDQFGNKLNAGKLLGDALVKDTRGNSVKYLDWGLKMFNGEDIEFDDTDLKTLIDYLEDENNTSLVNLVSGRILKYINESKK